MNTPTNRDMDCLNMPDPTSAPSTADVLLALADRCEGEEPSRDLDAEIIFSLFAKPVGENGYLWPEDDASWSFAIRFPGKDAAWFSQVRKGRPSLLVWRDGDPILVNDLRVKPVTSSLDAAVTLVPEGFIWSIASDDVGEVAKYSGTFLGENGDIERYGRGKTPALRLCAAALRARAALVQS